VRRVAPARPLRALAAGLLLWGASSVARAADAPAPAAVARDGDAAALVETLGPAYRAGTLDTWTARLYQDLRIEAGGRAALLEETRAAFPEPRTPTAAYLLARLAEGKDLDAGLQRLLPAAPDPAPLLLDLGGSALAADRLPAAVSLLAKIRRICPEREEAAILEARVLEAGGDRRAAERVLAAHVAVHPDSTEACRVWGDVLQAANRRADAVAVLEEGLARARAAPLLVGRAALAIDLFDLERARRCLDEVRDLGRPALRAHAQSLRGAVRLALHDLEGAEAAADAALRTCPASVHALRLKSRCLEVAGKTGDALRRLDAAIAVRPTWARLYADRGAVLLKAHQGKEARKALAEARRRDPDLLDAAFLVGVAEEEDGDFGAAEKAYRAVLKADPDHLPSHRMLGGVLYMLSKLDAADAEAGWVLDRDPKDAAAWFVRGRVALRQDRFDEALVAFGKAVEADPGYALGHTGRGWVFEEQDKWDEARKAYEAAIAADPRLALPHRYLGELLDEQLDDPVGALSHFKRYLELGGSDPDEDVWRAVQRLSK
jgi:tetratricopeptide (TPR) repeat protein